MDRVDYDSYIVKAEEALNKYPSRLIMKKYVEEYQFKQ
jgi:hypothetical protein